MEIVYARVNSRNYSCLGDGTWEEACADNLVHDASNNYSNGNCICIRELGHCNCWIKPTTQACTRLYSLSGHRLECTEIGIDRHIYIYIKAISCSPNQTRECWIAHTMAAAGIEHPRPWG